MHIYRTTADFEHLRQTADTTEQTDPVEAVRGCIKALVSIPAAVSVTLKGRSIIVQVHPVDIGRVVGAGGRTARALRTLLTAMSTNQQTRYALDLPDFSQMAPVASRSEPHGASRLVGTWLKS